MLLPQKRSLAAGELIPMGTINTFNLYLSLSHQDLIISKLTTDSLLHWR